MQHQCNCYTLQFILVYTLARDFVTGTQYWTKIKPASASPPIVYNHAAVKVSNSIYVYGGENETGLSKSIWEYKIGMATAILL